MINRLFCLILLCFLSALPALANNGISQFAPEPLSPTPEMAAQLLQIDGPVHVIRDDSSVPGWSVFEGPNLLGYLGSTWEIAGSVGYSGRPLDVLLAMSPEGRITGVQLMRHDEPILTLGISETAITQYVDGYTGYDLTDTTPGSEGGALPDVISRATVSTGVIRDGILRSARALAVARGIVAGSGVDRINYEPADWDALLAMGAVVGTRVSMSTAADALAGAKVPVLPGDDDFVHLWAGVVDSPTIGRNLLGPQEFARTLAALPTGHSALIVMSTGLQSHRGTDWKRTGIFDRLTIRQQDRDWHPGVAGYRLIRRLAISGSPEIREISLFDMPPTIDPTQPFTLELRATRVARSGDELAMTISLPYDLPSEFHMAPYTPEPLWRQIWVKKKLATGLVAGMLIILTVILFAQDSITRRPRLWRALRLSFLATTFLVLGMVLNGQLSVVQVVAFLHSLLTGFRWETFLIEPVIFLLWSFVALGLLFWGRGVYCGWLCPFGALQEILNAVAQRLGIRQITVPQPLHERLWVLKYSLFVGIVALSFYSMHDALILAEVEPFKTAISMRFVRAWPFVLFVVVILTAGLFIERFYCRYLCPLGAGLAIPAKLKIFDWLHRRPQCGRECRLCETKCTVGAIDSLGRINANECVLCLRCQVIMNDATQCPVLKRRARGATTPPPAPVRVPAPTQPVATDAVAP
ncbi:4Fe-4S binding protein [Phaeovulum sp.]|uniref:4Fe-4S binding protein n=1 Tax=Phaeovulum sp. TaxID=2934796 RepID=UPI0039E59A5B